MTGGPPARVPAVRGPAARGLPPITAEEPAILVLGSFPSAASLARREYYGFERNQFWQLVSIALGTVEPQGYPEKLKLLADSGIAVWDVIGECERAGSLDQAIRNARPNPIPGFALSFPRLRRIVVNGSAAAAYFVRFFRTGAPIPLAGEGILEWKPAADGGIRRTVQLVRVPSSSPVPSRAFRRLADKEAAWRVAFDLTL